MAMTITRYRGARGARVGCMLLAFMYLASPIALLLGIIVAAGAKAAPELFAGLTLVICAVMVLCACAIVAAVNALQRPPAAQPAPPPQQQAHDPFS
jgi:hypothetical protein